MTYATKHIAQDDLPGSVDWTHFADALEAGHRMPMAQVEDVFLGPSESSLLSRAAWIEGLGFGVKSVTVMAENATRGLPSIQGAMLVFDSDIGRLNATIDSALVTNIKTAADSVLGVRLLARRDSRTHLIVGAGSVAKQLVGAFRQVFLELERTQIYNRTKTRAEKLANKLRSEGIDVAVAPNLAEAAASADIISTATMSQSPVLLGEWVRPGTHVDLIGAFRAEMREADDALLQKAKIFVDSRETTLRHIGELKIPLESGAIRESDILADLCQLVGEKKGRTLPPFNIELRPGFRTLGSFTPVHERRTEWDNIDGTIRTRIRQQR